jgi:hypothetical protein
MHLCQEIEDLSDLDDALDGELPYRWSSSRPCYQDHIVDTEVLDTTKCSVGEFMSLFSMNSPDDTLFTYSVTTNEDNHQEWLDLAMMIPGSTIAVVERKDRTCYFCCVPNTPNLEAL